MSMFALLIPCSIHDEVLLLHVSGIGTEDGRHRSDSKFDGRLMTQLRWGIGDRNSGKQPTSMSQCPAARVIEASIIGEEWRNGRGAARYLERVFGVVVKAYGHENNPCHVRI